MNIIDFTAVLEPIAGSISIRRKPNGNVAYSDCRTASSTVNTTRATNIQVYHERSKRLMFRVIFYILFTFLPFKASSQQVIVGLSEASVGLILRQSIVPIVKQRQARQDTKSHLISVVPKPCRGYHLPLFFYMYILYIAGWNVKLLPD